MSKRIVTIMAVFGALLLQTGCAASASIARPRLPTIIIGELPPEPMPEPLPPPQPRVRRPLPPPPQPLSRGEAIALGQRWCNANGYGCALDDAEFHNRRGVWKLEFDAYRPGHHGRGTGHYKKNGRGHWKHGDNGELEMEIDAWSGSLLKVRFDD